MDNWLKVSGFGDMFKVPDSARQNMDYYGRQNAIDGALRSLDQYQQDPAISQIIVQLNTLKQQGQVSNQGM